MIKECKNCKQPFKTNRKTKQHCSDKCFSEYRRRPNVIFETQKKQKQTKLKKYGNENYNNMKKNKQTCFKKYGV